MEICFCSCADQPQSAAASGVDRSNKAAPMPEIEAGDALEGMNASGAGNDVKGSGKGPLETTVDKEAKKDESK